MAIRLTESNLQKMNRRNKASMIIKESCNKLIRENKTITYEQLFDTICDTSNKLHSKGVKSKYINEGVFDTIGDFFSSSPKGFMDSLKEKIFRWILPKIGIEGELLEYLTVAMGDLTLNDYKLFLSPLDNCERIADRLSDGLVEYAGTRLADKLDLDSSGIIGGTIRNAIADLVLEKGFVQDLQNKLTPVICKQIRSKLGGDAEKAVSDEILSDSPTVALS